MNVLIRRALCAAIASLAAAAAHAAYPEQPVRIVVAFAPGSGTDNVARYYATRLSEELKQPFVVENKPGANGSIAATQVARTQPDGYTLFLGSNSTLSAAPFLF
ncbi:tripartite tricarboxylate transporter family receptor domain protein, partial [Bordetella pertussis B200]